MSAIVTLHPGMTAQQICDWCAEHGMYVVIDFMPDGNGQNQPLIRAHRAPPPDEVPALLRRRGE